MDEIIYIAPIVIRIKIQFWTEAQLLHTMAMWHLRRSQSHGWQRAPVFQQAVLGIPREGLRMKILTSPNWSEFGSGFVVGALHPVVTTAQAQHELCDPGGGLHALTPVHINPGAQSLSSLLTSLLGHHHLQVSCNRDPRSYLPSNLTHFPLISRAGAR